MRIMEAIALINSVTYKPDWEITAWELDGIMAVIYPDSVRVAVEWTAPDTDRQYAEQGYPKTREMGTDFLVSLACTHEELLRQVLDGVLALEVHESREFFRVASMGYDAPFHPHREECREAWERTHERRSVAA